MIGPERIFMSFFTMAALSVWSVQVYAEPYIAGQAGVAFPQDLSGIVMEKIPEPTTPQGTKSSDWALADSGMYGVKAGYYSESWKWLGIEGEFFQLSPNVKQQIVGETPPGGATTNQLKPGANLIVNTMTLNAVARGQFGEWEPYVGVGPAGFIAQLNMVNRELGREPLAISSAVLGLNVEAGLRYRFLDHMSVFSEWKFNYGRFRFDSPAHVDATYKVHFLVFGIGYHF